MWDGDRIVRWAEQMSPAPSSAEATPKLVSEAPDILQAPWHETGSVSTASDSIREESLPEVLRAEIDLIQAG